MAAKVIVVGVCGLLTASCSSGVVHKSAAPTTTTTQSPPSPPIQGATPYTPPATTPPPSTTTTVPSPVFPPKTLGQAEALAATGNLTDVTLFNTHNNGSSSCPTVGYFVVVPSTLSDQAVAADLLAFYFQKSRTVSISGCGGLAIDAYNSQSEANSSGPAGGEATAGNIQLLNGKVFVDIGEAISPTVQFSFSYS
jgi:hypothetical protein